MCDQITWLPGMNFQAKNLSGGVWQFSEQPIFNERTQSWHTIPTAKSEMIFFGEKPEDASKTLVRREKPNQDLEIIKVIESTQGFKNAEPGARTMILSPSIFPILKMAINWKMVGMSYEQWQNSSTAGKLTKEIVEEIFSMTISDIIGEN